ncbi:UNVERIFIED_CONTAM: hypothetical protein FKN15_033658 [Acipenser sinensis]
METSLSTKTGGSYHNNKEKVKITAEIFQDGTQRLRPRLGELDNGTSERSLVLCHLTPSPLSVLQPPARLITPAPTKQAAGVTLKRDATQIKGVFKPH